MEMKMKSRLIILAAAAFFALNAEVLWQADFNRSMGGFTVKKNNPGDSVKVENGDLLMYCTHGIHKGIELSQEIPFPEKGELSFDVTVNVGKKTGYRAYSLKMLLFGKLLAWHASSKIGFSFYDPPGKWISIYGVQEDKKVNYRLRFDRVRKTLDVFIDGALLPSKSFSDVKFSEPSGGKGVLTFANYGYAPGNLTHRIGNVKLETCSDESELTEPKLVWSAKFEKDGPPADNGFHMFQDNGKDQFTVKDGVLTMVCENSPHKGMGYERTIPGLLVGELTFEAWTGQGAGYDYYGLSMAMGDMTFSWRARSAWHLYHRSEVKWYSLTSQVENGVWHKYKIRFDAAEKTAEFYVDDMVNPVFIDTKSEYVAKKELVFRIRNYGLCSGTVVNKVRNFELKAVPRRKEIRKDLDGTMIFRGVSDTYWPLKELAKSLGEKNVTEFFLQVPEHHLTNDNIRYDLLPKPTPQNAPAKYIILADMPAAPIPQYTMDMICRSVKDGGKLIVLDGVFTLQKGEYAGTVLEEILPVSVKDRWGDAVPLPEAKIHKHNGRDSIIYKQVGKGMVYVVPGNVIKDPSVADVLKTYHF